MQHNRCINGFATNSNNRTYVITVRHHLAYEGSIFYDSDIAAIVGEIRFELQPATHTPLPRNPSRTSPLVNINKRLPFGTCNATSTTSTTKPETEIWYELFLLDFLRNAIFVNSIYTMFAITNPIIQFPRFLHSFGHPHSIENLTTPSTQPFLTNSKRAYSHSFRNHTCLTKPLNGNTTPSSIYAKLKPLAPTSSLVKRSLLRASRRTTVL